MPMLSLRDSRLTDIDGDLSAILRMHKSRKRTTRIHVHFQRIRELVLRQIGQIQAEKFLCKRFIRHLRHYKCLRLCLELLQQIHNFAERHLMRHRYTAILPLRIQKRLYTVKRTIFNGIRPQ